jgi:4-hydroxythreonine-4-phosphate dehydrogenase
MRLPIMLNVPKDTRSPQTRSPESKQKLLAITMGDAAGIGPEVIVKAFMEEPELLEHCFVVGEVATLRRVAQAVHALMRSENPALHSLPWPVVQMEAPENEFPPQCIPVLELRAFDQPVPWGRVSASAGAMAGECVAWAADAALRGDISAVVTAPLHKEALSAAGLPWSRYPGHTELLQARAAAFLNRPVQELPVRMMLASDELRTVLVSIHLSLKDALAAVTSEQVLQTLRITHEALSLAWGRAPVIGVAGLNPHAGEGGLFGREELDIIAPAVAQACAEGIQASGPWAPDTVFMRARQTLGHPGEFDVVVAMYHDQGLIPIKYLGLDQGVNVTLGLPLVRTSPDHGTAFDLAGTGRADASSLKAAIRMAKVLAGVGLHAEVS